MSDVPCWEYVRTTVFLLHIPPQYQSGVFMSLSQTSYTWQAAVEAAPTIDFVASWVSNYDWQWKTKEVFVFTKGCRLHRLPCKFSLLAQTFLQRRGHTTGGAWWLNVLQQSTTAACSRAQFGKLKERNMFCSHEKKKKINNLFGKGMGVHFLFTPVVTLKIFVHFATPGQRHLLPFLPSSLFSSAGLDHLGVSCPSWPYYSSCQRLKNSYLGCLSVSN